MSGRSRARDPYQEALRDVLITRQAEAGLQNVDIHEANRNSKRSRIHEATISRLVKRETKIVTPEVVAAYARALGCKPIDLYREAVELFTARLKP